jgi:hypothetical protein
LSSAAFFASFFAFLGNPVFFFFTGRVPFFRPFLAFVLLEVTAEAILPAAFPMVFAAVTKTDSAGSSFVSFFDILETILMATTHFGAIIPAEFAAGFGMTITSTS